MGGGGSKLDLDGARRAVDAAEAERLLSAVFAALGCPAETGAAVAEHLVAANLSGVESHGVMRVLDYAQRFESGAWDPRATPAFIDGDAPMVDGAGGVGVPAMALAYEQAVALARRRGVAALAVKNVGHTGRHGAFAERAAEAGFVTISFGGGNRTAWRQVAPHGGARALLPTNPWCVGVPGGAAGPMVLDCATSMIAGGWIYAARSAGARLPEGCVIDRHGRPTRDPEDYFAGGAILPSGGHKGYGLALAAELVAEAMLGPVVVECHWLVIALDASRWATPPRLQAVAEEILAEIRACPPAPGFDRVEVPGERERRAREAAGGVIHVPERTWEQILALAARLRR